MNPYHYRDSLENIPEEQLCQDFYLKREKMTYYHIYFTQQNSTL